MAKQSAPAATEGMVLLDPSLIQAEDNARYSVKDIDGMMASIKQAGGIMVPVEVEPLGQAVNGFKYRLTYGFLRHAAVVKLNTEESAGLPIPATIHVNTSPVERLRRQIAENLERQSLSPMDTAVAIKKLLDNGVTKIEVREIFATKGGRKGNKVQLASNSYVNMMLSFLELPKKYQAKIDAGLLTTTGAWELYKAPPEKRDAIFDAAEAEIKDVLEMEEKAEKKFNEAEKKAIDSEAKQKETNEALAAAASKLDAARAVLVEKAEIAKRAYEAKQEKNPDAKARKALDDNFKEAEKVRAEAQREAEKAENEAGFLAEKHKKAQELAATHAAKLLAARNAASSKAGKKAAVSGKDVAKAAVTAGASESVGLSLKEFREGLNYLMLPGGNPKTAAIGKALVTFIKGEMADREGKQLAKEIDKIVK